MGVRVINPNFNLEEAAEHKRLLNVERLAKENVLLKAQIQMLEQEKEFISGCIQELALIFYEHEESVEGGSDNG